MSKLKIEMSYVELEKWAELIESKCNFIKLNGITPADFENLMKEIIFREDNECWNETVHKSADNLMASLLIYFGYLNGIQIYNHMEKNYSY